ncbi:hypothetical protein LEP1GSC052_0309 [Leptospira kmetyi serovar Malaysia str. Bejo-Iso9]|nr:hypothetical protein LEP1GSC052_0309 [Leptospira kmetyi serovar Malaysia str. Bejo-Iso9]
MDWIFGMGLVFIAGKDSKKTFHSVEKIFDSLEIPNQAAIVARMKTPSL